MNSSKFFSNKECEYYPCHKSDEDLNCLFCYCPLYRLEKCPGTYEIIEVKKKDQDGNVVKPVETYQVKSCIDCTFPHKAENYDTIMKLLKFMNENKM